MENHSDISKNFIPYDLALKLKELGFDEPCFGYYTPMKEWMMKGTRLNPKRHFHGCNWANSDNSMYFMYKQNSFGDRDSVVKNSEFTKAIHNVAAPLWQQVIDWFRIKYNWLIVVDVANSNEYYAAIREYDKIGAIISKIPYKIYSIYEEAREQAILKAIELIKNKN